MRMRKEFHHHFTFNPRKFLNIQLNLTPLEHYPTLASIFCTLDTDQRTTHLQSKVAPKEKRGIFQYFKQLEKKYAGAAALSCALSHLVKVERKGPDEPEPVEGVQPEQDEEHPDDDLVRVRLAVDPGDARRVVVVPLLVLRVEPPARGEGGRAFRFSKMFSDFCSDQGLNHPILYLKRSGRSIKSKE